MGVGNHVAWAHARVGTSTMAAIAAKNWGALLRMVATCYERGTRPPYKATLPPRGIARNRECCNSGGQDCGEAAKAKSERQAAKAPGGGIYVFFFQ
jgi:hypothetical protein